MSAGALLGAVGCGSAEIAVGPARNVVVVMVDGGWDPTFALDPKLGVSGVQGPLADAPQSTEDREDTGRWGPLEIAVNPVRRPAVSQFFDRWSKRLSVVRGLWVGSVSHWIGRRRVLTGRDDRRASDWISQLGAFRRDDRPLGVVDLSGHGRFGDGSATSLRAGRRGQLGQLLIPERRLPTGDGTPRPTLARMPGDDRLLDEWLAARAIDDPRRRFGRPWHQALDARTLARQRAAALLDRVPSWSATLSGATGLRADVDLTIALLEHRITRAVLLDSGHSWDSHADHGRQHGWYQSLFVGVGQLLTGLEARGLLDETLVVVLSEMGRTGVRNGEDGTEHWPYTAALLAGADIEGPHRVGSTDDSLVGVPPDGHRGRLRYDEFIAGILSLAGLDPGWLLPDVEPVSGLRGPRV